MKLTWFLLGVIVTIVIELIGSPFLYRWNNRFGVPSSSYQLTTINGKIEKFGSTEQPVFVISNSKTTTPLTIANDSQAPVRQALVATVGTDVLARGLIYPNNSAFFYILSLNGKTVDSAKDVLDRGIPTIAMLVVNQPQRTEVESCLKKSLGEEYAATLAKTLPSLDTDHVKRVSDCFVDLSDQLQSNESAPAQE